MYHSYIGRQLLLSALFLISYEKVRLYSGLIKMTDVELQALICQTWDCILSVVEQYMEHISATICTALMLDINNVGFKIY